LRLITISELPAAPLVSAAAGAAVLLVSAGAGAAVAAVLPVSLAAGAAVGWVAPLLAPPPHALNPSAALISSTAPIQGSRFVVRILSSFLKEILRDVPINDNLVFCTRGYRAAHRDVLSGVKELNVLRMPNALLGAAATLLWEDDLLV